MQQRALGDLTFPHPRPGAGSLDIYVANHKEANRLLLNDGLGGFVSASRPTVGDAVATDKWSRAAVAGDFDRDSDVDIMVINERAANQLLINNGAGVFAFDGDALPAQSDWSYGAAAGDFDGDGFLGARNLHAPTHCPALTPTLRVETTDVFEPVWWQSLFYDETSLCVLTTANLATGDPGFCTSTHHTVNCEYAPGCTTAQCCTVDRGLTCGDADGFLPATDPFDCNGHKMDLSTNPAAIKCGADPCTDSECCTVVVTTCADADGGETANTPAFNCKNGWTLRPDPGNSTCALADCTRAECCVAPPAEDSGRRALSHTATVSGPEAASGAAGRRHLQSDPLHSALDGSACTACTPVANSVAVTCTTAFNSRAVCAAGYQHTDNADRRSSDTCTIKPSNCVSNYLNDGVSGGFPASLCTAAGMTLSLPPPEMQCSAETCVALECCEVLCTPVQNAASVSCSAVANSRAVCNRGYYKKDNSAMGTSDACSVCTPVANAASVTCLGPSNSRAVCLVGFARTDHSASGTSDSCILERRNCATNWDGLSGGAFPAANCTSGWSPKLLLPRTECADSPCSASGVSGCCEPTTCAHGSPCGSGANCTDLMSGGYLCSCAAGTFRATAMVAGVGPQDSCVACSAVPGAMAVACSAAGNSRAVCDAGHFRVDNSAVGASDACSPCAPAANATLTVCSTIFDSRAETCAPGYTLISGACAVACAGPNDCAATVSNCANRPSALHDFSCECAAGHYSRLGLEAAPRAMPAGWTEGQAPQPSPTPTRPRDSVNVPAPAPIIIVANITPPARAPPPPNSLGGFTPSCAQRSTPLKDCAPDDVTYQFFMPITQDGQVDAIKSSFAQQLVEQLWVDSQTKDVQIEFVIYNGNLQLFAVTTVTFEFNSAGGMSSSIAVTPLDLEVNGRYEYYHPWYLMEFALVLYIVVTGMGEVKDLWEAHKYHGTAWAYFSSPWNYFDLAQLAAFVFCGVRWLDLFDVMAKINISQRFDWGDSAGNTQGERDAFWLTSSGQLLLRDCEAAGISDRGDCTPQVLLVDLIDKIHTADQLFGTYKTATVGNLFLTLVRVFKFARFHPHLSMVSRTLTHAKDGLVHFLLLMTVVMWVMAAQLKVIYGRELETASTWGQSLNLFFLMSLGAFPDETADVANNSWLAILWFYFFFILVFFVLVNFFLAIVMDGYEDAKEEIQGENSVFEDFEVWWSKSVVQHLCHRKRAHHTKVLPYKSERRRKHLCVGKRLDIDLVEELGLVDAIAALSNPKMRKLLEAADMRLEQAQATIEEKNATIHALEGTRPTPRTSSSVAVASSKYVDDADDDITDAEIEAMAAKLLAGA